MIERMESLWVLKIRVTADLEVVAMKGYPTFYKAFELEPHHQMQFSVIKRTLVVGRVLITLVRYSATQSTTLMKD